MNPTTTPTLAGDRPWLLYGLIVLLVAALFLPWLGHKPLIHQETRRVTVTRNMTASGDYLVPHFAGRVYLNKPPVFNWVMLATSAPFDGITRFSARLPSVLSLAALALFMVATVGRRLAPPGRWLLGLSLVVTGALMQKAVAAQIDMLFTLLVSLCLWVWFELDERGRRGLALWLPPAILVAIAFLTKREPALVFYYLAIGGYLLYRRRLLELFRPAHLIAAAVTLALIGAWVGLLIRGVGWQALLDNVQREVLTRGVDTDAGDYLRHLAGYPFQLLVSALPATILLIPFAWRSVRTAVRARHPRIAAFALIAVLINLPIYWFRADAAVRYFAPMLPTLLVLPALAVDVWVRDRERLTPGAQRAFMVSGWVMLALAAIIAAVALAGTVPGLLPKVVGPLVPAPLMALLCVAALATAVWLVRHRRRNTLFVVTAVVGFGVLFQLFTLGYVLPRDTQKIEANHHMEANLERIRAALPAGVERVQALGKLPHAIYYFDRAHMLIPPAEAPTDGPLRGYVLFVESRRADLPRLDRPLTPIARLPFDEGTLILARIGPPASSR